MGTKKGKTTLPGLLQPPGPRGHPDVALPICNQHPTTGALVARNEKTALLTMWGMAKATATPVVVREVQDTKRGLEVKDEYTTSMVYPNSFT